MRRLSALLVAVLFIGAGNPGSARAADTDVIDALALVPSGALYLEGAAKKPFAPGSIRAVATSLRVTRSLSAPGVQAWRRLSSSLSPLIFFPSARLALEYPERWREAVGVSLEEVTAVVIFGDAGPNKGAVWVLPDESVAARLLAHLRTRGFTSGEGEWLVNGDVNKLDLHNRAPVDPFRGSIGESYAVRQDGRIIYQQKAINPPPAPPIIQTAFAAARNALHDTSQDVTLVQAIVVSPLIEAPELARAEDMQPVPTDQPRDPAEMAKLWEAERQRSAAAMRVAIPFTPLAVVADFEESAAARRGVIVILPYEDCDVARTANARFPALWQAAPTTIIAHMARPDAVVTTALLNQGAGCTAVIRVTTQAATDTIVNPVWRYIEWVFWERLPGPFAMAPP